MRHTLLILSHLLRYPSEAMQQAAPELVAALELDGVLESGQIEEVKPLVQALIDDERPAVQSLLGEEDDLVQLAELRRLVVDGEADRHLAGLGEDSGQGVGIVE